MTLRYINRLTGETVTVKDAPRKSPKGRSKKTAAAVIFGAIFGTTLGFLVPLQTTTAASSETIVETDCLDGSRLVQRVPAGGTVLLCR